MIIIIIKSNNDSDSLFIIIFKYLIYNIIKIGILLVY